MSRRDWHSILWPFWDTVANSGMQKGSCAFCCLGKLRAVGVLYAGLLQLTFGECDSAELGAGVLSNHPCIFQAPRFLFSE